MKLVLLQVWALALLTALASEVAGCRKEQRPALIGIVQFVHHPLLDETHKGLMAELDKQGLNDGVHYKVETVIADKSFEASAQAVRQFLNREAVLIVAIATPAAQAAAAQTSNTPIVFAAITDPVGAKLVQSNERPEKNLTGTSNRWPFEKQVELLPLLVPKAKRIGMIWNTSELNSQSAMNVLRPLLRGKGYEVVEAPVTTTMEVAEVVRSLATRVDAFMMVPDNTTLAATTVFSEIAQELKVPLIGGDKDTVRQGSLATYGYDYFELGQVTGEMVKEVLSDGKSPSSMAVRYPQKTTLIINEAACKNFGIEIPVELQNLPHEVAK